VLVEFHEHDFEGLAGDAESPPVRLLIAKGVLRDDGGAGGYEWVNRYISVNPDFCECLREWFNTDTSVPDVAASYRQYVEDHRNDPMP